MGDETAMGTNASPSDCTYSERLLGDANRSVWTDELIDSQIDG